MPEQQHFINWMKALGMFLIVYGHVVGDPHHLFNAATQPIYTKQIGVAFFVFVMGWGLAQDKRPVIQVLYLRLFPIYFYGVLGAIGASVLFYFLIGDINESNYLPFIFGINVVLNYFPANPTTWYIGLYLHLLLFWCLFLKNTRITGKHAAFALCLEILVRTVLTAMQYNFTAYMLLSNWMGVFTLGFWLHQRKDCASHRLSAPALTAVWLGILCAWAWFFEQFGSHPYLNKSFPFRAFDSEFTLHLLLRSSLVSMMYLANTYVFFEIFRRWRANAWVHFFARNTLIIFIVHMIVVYSASGWFYRWVSGPRWLEQHLFIAFLFVGIALASEALERCIKVKRIRNWLWQLTFNRLNASHKQKLGLI